MILEIAQIDVKPGREADFEAGVTKAAPLFQRAKGCLGMELQRSIEKPGRYRLFVNGENLTGTRQTKWSPLLRPRPSADGRVTVDAWAPLEGRTINGGVRIAF